MNQTVKTKKNLKLRKVGPHYMIVNADGGQVNMTQVFKLNQTAALLWEKLSEKEPLRKNWPITCAAALTSHPKLHLPMLRPNWQNGKPTG